MDAILPDFAWLIVAGAASAAAFALGRKTARAPAAAKAKGEARPDSDSEHRTIFDASPALIWYKDRQNRILRINRTAAAGLGRAVDEIEGRRTEEFYPDEAERYYKDDLEVIESGEPKLGIIEPLVDKAGHKGWVRTDKIPYRNAKGEIVGVVVFALDITDQKRAEANLEAALAAAERANSAKSEFLANVSHEIRTPLGVMMGFAELLTTARDGVARADFAEKILRNGERLQRLIDDLLDLSRIERGRMPIERTAFRLPDLLADVTSLLAGRARDKGIGFAVLNTGPVPEMIVSDPLRLRQILLNIIGNAIKFTDRGHVAVEIGLTDADAGRLSIVVRDTGKGIAPDRAADLFQPFYQSDPTDARKYGGSGLGLALSRRLAQGLGGDVTLEASEPGRGTTFRITLAVGKVDLPPAEPTATAITAAIADSPLVRKPLKILFAEDNPDIQEMVRHYLKIDGVTLIVVGSGRQAVDTALTERPDLVLMDLQLPVLGGLEAVRELRRAAFQAPILAMTAHAMESQRHACLAAGFTDFLAKPVSRKDLLARINSVLGRPPA